MKGITISSQKAKLEIQSTPARLNIQNPRPRMSIKTRPARMYVSRQTPKFKVNWEKVRSESGLAPIVRFMVQTGRENHQKGWDAVGIIVEKGNRMKEMRYGDQVAQIAYERGQPKPPEVNLGRMPENLPEIEWGMGHLTIDWEAYEFSIEWDLSGPKITADPYTVEIRMSQYPSVTIKFDPDVIDHPAAKRKVDRKI